MIWIVFTKVIVSMKECELIHIYFVDRIPILAKSREDALEKFEKFKEEQKKIPVGWFAGEPVYI